MEQEQKRNAERLPLETPFDAVAGDRAVRIVEISLIGCRIEHVGRLPIGGATVLEFAWNGQDIRVPAAISRSKMLGFAPGGGERYESGLRFAVSVETAPEQLKQILASFVEESPAAPPLHEKVPFLRWYDDDADEPEPEPEREYIECTLVDETTWERRRVRDSRQPREGFTTVLLADDEIELLCRTYQYADPETRKLIRLTMELEIVERLKR